METEIVAKLVGDGRQGVRLEVLKSERIDAEKVIAHRPDTNTRIVDLVVSDKLLHIHEV